MHQDAVCSDEAKDPDTAVQPVVEVFRGRVKVAEESQINGRKDLINLLRGYFACPVISSLGELGIADGMLQESFSASDFVSFAEEDKLQAIFRYLHGIGIVAPVGEARYTLTKMGRSSMSRNGAFSLLASYAAYFSGLSSLITGKSPKPSVNRVLNVRGSGQLHGRKFFPAALELLQSEPPSALIDVGCGDGCFLECVCTHWQDLPIYGVDLSGDAVRATENRLGARRTAGGVAIAADGFEVKTWFESLPDQLRASSALTISMWFVAHEFSQGRPDRISMFLRNLNALFPAARVVLGEICDVPPDILAQNHETSIMPEYLLFHELSGQGVLSWKDWNQILEESPYCLDGERRFDEISVVGDRSIPASFVWLLSPRGLERS